MKHLPKLNHELKSKTLYERTSCYVIRFVMPLLLHVLNFANDLVESEVAKEKFVEIFGVFSDVQDLARTDHFLH